MTVSFGDHDLAARMKDAIDAIAREAIDHERPLYRYATVQSVDHDNRVCVVRFPGETTDVTVKMGALQPTSAGQIVRVDGYRGDRWVVDVIGGPVFTASTSGSSLTAPANFTLVQTLGAIVAQWDEVTDAYKYELQLAEDEAFTANVRNVTTYELSHRFDNLDPDVVYYGRVRSSTQWGSPSDWSASANTSPLRFVGQGDGVAPASSPAVTCESGLGMIVASWAPSANQDPVSFAVYADTNSGFTPSAATKIGETTSTFFVVDRLADGTLLTTLYGTNVYVRIIEIDPDGSGPASVQGVAAPRRVETGDVANIAGDKILDGLAPSASPDSPTLRPGIGFIYASWTHVSNPDMVTYEVHISTLSPTFTPGPTTLVQETPSNYTFIRRVGSADGGGALANGVTYYVRLVAKDPDGSASPGVASTTVLLKAQTGDIEELAITTALIADLAVDNGKINNLAVTEAKIADANIVEAKIADLNVTEAKIANLAVSTAKIQALAVTTAKIYDAAITAAKIDNLAVTNAHINDLNASKINAGYLSASRIQAGTITGSHLAVDTITANNIVASTITATEIAASTITGNEIAGGTITGSNIGNNTITGSNVAGSTITGSNIAGSTITGSNISGSTITNSHLVDVSASKLTTGTLSASTSITIASGGYIQSSSYIAGSSGFRINGNGSAEFNNVTIRGTVYASAGEFTGTVRSANFGGANAVELNAGYAYIKTAYAQTNLYSASSGRLGISGGSYSGSVGSQSYGFGINATTASIEGSTTYFYSGATQKGYYTSSQWYFTLGLAAASTDVNINAGTGQLFAVVSSGLFKDNMAPMDRAKSKSVVRAIVPKSYTSTIPEEDPTRTQLGFIAEEVAAANPKLVNWEYPRKREIRQFDRDGVIEEMEVEVPDTTQEKIPLTLNKWAMLAELWNFVQDLDNRVNALEAV